MANGGPIVVTGAAGFIGSHVVDVLLARGETVIGIDNLSTGRLENLGQHENNPRFTFHQLDIRDLADYRAVTRGIGALIHLAAFKIPRYGQRLETLRNNVVGGENSLEIARLEDCRIVIASTSDVYGRNPKLPFAETDDLVYGPSAVRRWAYAVSKLYEEHLCYAYREDFGLDFVLLRFFGSYGPRQDLTWRGGPHALFIQAVFDDREIEIHGDGTQTRTFTYVSDTVNGVIRALDTPAASGEIINIGSTEEITILELARLIKELCATPGTLKIRFIPYESFGAQYQDVQRRVPDNTKAAALLGFQARVPLAVGLKQTIEWMRSAQPAVAQIA